MPEFFCKEHVCDDGGMIYIAEIDTEQHAHDVVRAWVEDNITAGVWLKSISRNITSGEFLGLRATVVITVSITEIATNRESDLALLRLRFG